MDQSEFQKSQLPNTSLDDSPFLNIKTSKLRKKKTQSKLTYLKQVSTKRKNSDAPKTSENEDHIQCETKRKENTLWTSPGESPSSLDAIHENASGNKEENIVCACPVCWKRFENSGDQMQHMKTCASKHNLTLKQLLDAVDLQTKQIEERKLLGLPCVLTTGIAKKSISKKSSSVSYKDDPDFQLGLALSVSMQESEEQNNVVEQEIMLEAGLGDEVAANQASLLERFGFTNTRPVLPSIYPRARPGKLAWKFRFSSLISYLS
ncbi:Uncharacterized protein GBIM_21039 [Gryllus bimaculatus]|nr:Uncharacterized protein GBIM_21039 [Gryllus bimaculatus]